MFVIFYFCWCVCVVGRRYAGFRDHNSLRPQAGVFYPEIHHLGASGKGGYPPNLVIFRLGHLKMLNHDKPSTFFLLHYFFSDKPAVSCLEFEHWPSPTWWIWALWGSPILWIHITRALGHGSSPRKMACSIMFHPSVYVQTTACVYSIYIDTVIWSIKYLILYIYNYTGHLYI